LIPGPPENKAMHPASRPVVDRAEELRLLREDCAALRITLYRFLRELDRLDAYNEDKPA
jgi:hypothetical protein